MGEADTVPGKQRPDLTGMGTWIDWLNTKQEAVTNNHTWTVTFNKQVNPTTVTDKNVFVVDQDGYLVEGVSVRSNGDTISVIAPANNYDSNKIYTLYIRNAIKNTDGEALKSNIKI